MRLSACVGHRQALELVTRAASRGALPHSLLFAGPDGVGKYTIATALATALNCDTPVTGQSPIHIDGCGVCRSCERFARVLAHLREGRDVALDCFVRLQPDDKGVIKVEPVREVLARTAFRPFDGKRRVVVIDDADGLRVEAQNALLKVLEEPPDATVFVLVSSRPDQLLTTVRSRCPRVRFGPLSTTQVADVLTRHHGIASAEAATLAAASDGSVGTALGRASGTFIADRDAALDVLESASSPQVRTRLQGGQILLRRAAAGKGKKDGSMTRQALQARLDALRSVTRDVCAMGAGADSRLVGNEDVTDRMQRLASTLDVPRLIRASAAIDRASAALDRNAQVKVVAEWLALQL